MLTDAWTAEPRDDRRGASKPELGLVLTAFCMRAYIRTQSHASRVPAGQAGRARHLHERHSRKEARNTSQKNQQMHPSLCHGEMQCEKAFAGQFSRPPKRGRHDKDPNVSLKVGIQLLHVITMSLHFCASAMPFNISVLIDI